MLIDCSAPIIGRPMWYKNRPAVRTRFSTGVLVGPTLGDRIAVFNQGHIEQLGRPLELYEKPATEFVASFIGSPPMNLLKNAPNQAHGGPAGALFGIRPEHLDITADGWPVQTEAIETLGAERLVYGKSNGEQIIVRIDEQHKPPAIGSTFHVTPRADRLHWFDAASGKRLG